MIGRRVFRYRVVRPLRPAGLKLEEDQLNPEPTDRNNVEYMLNSVDIDFQAPVSYLNIL